jgi:hypothetical protein
MGGKTFSEVRRSVVTIGIRGGQLPALIRLARG